MSKPSGGIRSLHSLSAWACQRRLLPLPVFVTLIFRCFLVQAGNFILYGVCKFICLSSFMYNRFHKELRFFFSLLKRKKEAKKEKSSHSTCIIRFKYHPKFPPTKIPRRGIQAAAAAVTLPFSQLKLGRKVSGDPPRGVRSAVTRRPPQKENLLCIPLQQSQPHTLPAALP